MNGIIFTDVVNITKGFQLSSGRIQFNTANAPVSGDVLTAISSSSAKFQSQSSSVGMSAVTGIGITGQGFLSGAIALIPTGDLQMQYSGNNIALGIAMAPIDSTGFVSLTGSQSILGAKTFNNTVTFVSGSTSGTTVINRNNILIERRVSMDVPVSLGQNSLNFTASFITGLSVGTLINSAATTITVTGYPATSGVSSSVFYCQTTGVTGILASAYPNGTNQVDILFQNNNVISIGVGVLNIGLLKVATTNFSI